MSGVSPPRGVIQVKQALVLRKVATELVDVSRDHARATRGSRQQLLANKETFRHARVGVSFGELELLAPKPGETFCAS